MKRLVIIALACLAAVLTSIPARTAPPEARLRVLLTYGGHDFQEKEFFAMWDALPGVSYTKAPLPQSADLLKPGLEKDYDVIVFYDMVKELSPAQQQGLIALLDRGIGVVSLHHNLGANLEWPEYHQVIGGTWLAQQAHRSTAGSTDRRPTSMARRSRSRSPTRTTRSRRGSSDFVIHDETYGNTYVSPTVHVLLKADNPKNASPFAWVSQHGKSRVVYFQAGHDAEAWKHPCFQEILKRSIRWAAQRE